MTVLLLFKPALPVFSRFFATWHTPRYAGVLFYTHPVACATM